MPAYALEVQGYSYSYGTSGSNVLSDVTFWLAQGSFAVLCGVSGSGKSTLLRALKPQLAVAGESRGSVRVLGDDPRSLSPAESAARVGFVMQDPENQIVTDTVWHELAFGLECIGMDIQTMRRRVAETANFFGISGWFDRKTADLSGGQKQLLNLAAIVVMQPSVLALDEPTSQLDPIAARDFFNVLERVNEELGITVLIIDHRLEDVLPLADRVLCLDAGGALAYDGDRDGFVRMLVERGEGLEAALPAATRMGRCLRHANVFPEDGSPFPVTVREGRSLLSQALAATFPRDNTALARPRGNEAAPGETPIDSCRCIVPQRASEDVRESSKQTSVPTNPSMFPTTLRDVMNPQARSHRFPSEVALCARDVWFRYDRRAPFVLRGVDFDVYDGCISAIVGGNGCGKSTLLMTLAGVRRPMRGRVANLRGWRVALMTQNPRLLFVRDTLMDDLLEWGTVAGYDRREVDDMLERLGLGGLRMRHPYDLSGGEIQKAALAKLLLLRPDVLLLDEPVKGLDAPTKAQIGGILTDVALGEGKAVVITSHDLEFVAEYAHTCSMVFGGEVTCTQDAHDFFVDNLFYSTPTARIARGMLDGCVTTADVAASFGVDTGHRHVWDTHD